MGQSQRLPQTTADNLHRSKGPGVIHSGWSQQSDGTDLLTIYRIRRHNHRAFRERLQPGLGTNCNADAPLDEPTKQADHHQLLFEKRKDGRHRFDGLELPGHLRRSPDVDVSTSDIGWFNRRQTSGDESVDDIVAGRRNRQAASEGPTDQRIIDRSGCPRHGIPVGVGWQGEHGALDRPARRDHHDQGATIAEIDDLGRSDLGRVVGGTHHHGRIGCELGQQSTGVDQTALELALRVLEKGADQPGLRDVEAARPKRIHEVAVARLGRHPTRRRVGLHQKPVVFEGGHVVANRGCRDIEVGQLRDRSRPDGQGSVDETLHHRTQHRCLALVHHASKTRYYDPNRACGLPQPLTPSAAGFAPSLRAMAGSTTQLSEVLDEVERAVLGKRDVLELLLVALVAGGHVLIEDVPGVAKTLMARSLAAATDLHFGRVQFTPDLVPSDITGSALPSPEDNRLVFEPGPVFANLVLGDEINRAPPKTQAALLEAMEESQVTVDGTTHPLPAPFMVIATQNPIESDGTYPLPHAQLDRFMFKLAVGPLSDADELAVLRQRIDRGTERIDLRVVLSGHAVESARAAAERVRVDDDLLRYATSLAGATRSDPDVEVGVSTRGVVALVRAARARAVVRNRDFALPDDVKSLAPAVFGHRLVLSTEAWVRGISAHQVVERCLETVPVPAALTEDDHATLRRD